MELLNVFFADLFHIVLWNFLTLKRTDVYNVKNGNL